MSKKQIYLVRATKDDPLYKVETAKSYCDRKNLQFNNSSNLKKIARMARVRKAGLVKTLATAHDLTKYKEL